MQFDERLKYLRNEKGLSEKELADELETTETTIRLLEKRKKDVKIDLLEKMADFFGVSTKLLLGTVFENLEPEEAVKSYRLVQELELVRKQEKEAAAAKASSIAAEQGPPPPGLGPVSTPIPQPSRQRRPHQDTLYASRVALYRTLSGTNPEEWSKFIEEYWPLTVSITNIYGDDLSNYFYLRVEGEKMSPTLKEGEIMLIKKQSNLQNNEVGVVLCDWGEVITARITHSVDKMVIYFDNQTYPAQVHDDSQCRILGKVLWKTTRPPK